MRSAVRGLAGMALAALALAACKPVGGVGYVEIKTVPVATVTQPALYLDTVKLDPLKKGNAVLAQRVGTAKLQVEGGGGHLAPICEVVVKENRITTVTISVLERPPRCQCRNSAGIDRVSNRTCIS